MDARGRIWLLLPALLLYMADITLTLVGQSSAFWAGDHTNVTEKNPIADPLLRNGPICFLAAAVSWGIAFSLIAGFARVSIAQMIVYLLALGHAIGSATWLTRHGAISWFGAVGWLATAA